MTDRSTSTSLADRPMSGSSEEQEHPLAQTGQQAGETMGHLAERASNLGFQQADERRETAAQRLRTLASSIRKVSSDMESEEPSMANLASTAADQTERLAGYLRNTDARHMLNTAEDFARRQPALFLGGAFLLGLAATRFIKAANGGESAGSRASGVGGRASAGYGTDYGPRTGYGAGYGAGTGYGTDYRAGTTGDYRATGPGSTESFGSERPTDEGM